MSEENKSLSTEERITELENRVAKLEKIEKDRKTKRIIVICIKLAFYIGIIIAMYLLFKKIMPVYNQVNDIRNAFGGGSSSSLDLNNYDLNGLLNGLFN